MGRKRGRERLVNLQPFLTDQNAVVPKLKPSKCSRKQEHHPQQQMISSSMSDKILKEAFKQQKDIIDEQNEEFAAFSVAFDDQKEEEEDEDIDDFIGFAEKPETAYQFDYYEDQIDEEDERLLEAFLSKDAGPQRTLGDVIAARIKEQDVTVSSEGRLMPKLDNSIVEHYKTMAKLLSTYTVGKLPKGFKHIPANKFWQEILYLTEPENWSPAAVFEATKIFASNMNSKKAQNFYQLVLLPQVREDIRKRRVIREDLIKQKKLHPGLYKALEKALYKPAAFYNGILLPLFKSGNCNIDEAKIMGSVIQKMSIPVVHSSVALMKLAEMDYCGTTSFIIKILIDKKYALPYRVLDALVAHFMRFIDELKVMPVIWHLTLLTFVQRYKHELRNEDKENLDALLQNQKHYLVTPEILRELKDSHNRGQKGDDSMLMSSPVSVINNTIEEDRFDVPEVPMEEDD